MGVGETGFVHSQASNTNRGDTTTALYIKIQLHNAPQVHAK